MEEIKNKLITIVDYGAGNILSIKNMLKKIDYFSIISSDVEEIKKAKFLIIPGVGSFDYGVNNLKKLKLFDVLNHEVLINKTPVLGICLGMQLMCKKSEEGFEKGFEWLDAEVKKFDFEKPVRVPHMGWNTIDIRSNLNFFKNDNEFRKFYFTHSYYVHCNHDNDVVATTNYHKDFVSFFSKDNIYGVQFHPEKSHKYGKEILKTIIDKEFDII